MTAINKREARFLARMSAKEDVCARCKETKPVSDFMKDTSKRAGRSCYCKKCGVACKSEKYYADAAEVARISAKNKEYRALNFEKISEQRRAAYAAGGATLAAAKSAYNKQYRANNIAKLSAYQRAYYKSYYLKNRAEVIEKNNSRRRAAMHNATCRSEFDELVIKEAYALRDMRNDYTNVAWHVDHIEPLNGLDVCGLHNAFNLAVIPALSNLKKGRKRHAEVRVQ